MICRTIASLACLAMFVAPGISQEKDRSPDEQVKELIEKYKALPEKDKVAAKGDDLIKQMKALASKLSRPAQEEVARWATSHNLRQLASAVHDVHKQIAQLPKAKEAADPKLFDFLLPYVTPLAARWEYKVVSELDLTKLGKDDLTAGLNKLGSDGWELVGFERARFILKRQVVTLQAP